MLTNLRAAAVAGAVVLATGLSPAHASLQGSTYDFSLSGSGILSQSPNGTYTDPSNPGFCIGPAQGCQNNSGVSSSFTFSDTSPTAAEITFAFFGSAGGSSSFNLDLSNF